MVSTQRNSFLYSWQRVGFFRGREGNNLLVHACGTNSLFLFSFFLCFPFFSLIFPFSSFFLVTPCFYFLVFKFSIVFSSSPSLLLLYTTKASFYSAYRDWILLFQPLTAFADHHVCVLLPITRQRRLFHLLVCHGTPFLLRCGCLLSPCPSWHALSGPAQFCPFGWCVIPTGHFP